MKTNSWSTKDSNRMTGYGNAGTMSYLATSRHCRRNHLPLNSKINNSSPPTKASKDKNKTILNCSHTIEASKKSTRNSIMLTTNFRKTMIFSRHTPKPVIAPPTKTLKTWGSSMNAVLSLSTPKTTHSKQNAKVFTRKINTLDNNYKFRHKTTAKPNIWKKPSTKNSKLPWIWMQNCSNGRKIMRDWRDRWVRWCSASQIRHKR